MEKELETFADAILKCETQKEACEIVFECGTTMIERLWQYYDKDKKAKQACEHANDLIEFDDPDTIY